MVFTYNRVTFTFEIYRGTSCEFGANLTKTECAEDNILHIAQQ